MNKKWNYINISENELIHKWTNYVKDIEEENIKITTAILLDNQDIFNKVSTFSHAGFEEISLRLIAKIYPNLIVHELGNVVAMLGPAMEIHGEPLAAYTRKLPQYIDFNQINIDQLSKEIIKGFDIEVIKDLWGNAGSEFVYSNSANSVNERFYSALTKLETDKFDFVVTSENQYNEFKDIVDYYAKSIICPNEWNKNGFLVGMKSDKSYGYFPYLPFAITPTTNANCFGVLTRYGKRLFKRGSTYYSKIRRQDQVEYYV
jgi:hypothetical protein